jgi:tRNA(His) 5'-end guanylyltransferase
MTSLGDRMKWYEKNFSLPKAVPLLPIIARLDGRAFHTWTKGLLKPFDNEFMETMAYTTKKLVEETNAVIGYTQSDEISLIFYSDNLDSQVFFDGKMQKINSILPSMCTQFFNHIAHDFIAFADKPPAFFDCRVWQVPTLREAGLYLLWREEDATRNSIQSVGQANFSHSKLQNLSCKQIQEKLFQERKINWNDYSSSEKRGTYFRKETISSTISAEELSSLPPKHNARTDPNFKIIRHSIERIELPQMAHITNREDVIFNGAEPEGRKEEEQE